MRSALIAVAAFVLLVVADVHAARIAVDVGHNDIAKGEVSSSGVAEFDLNRRFAERLTMALVDLGHDVVDVHAAGADRGVADRIYASRGVDLFLSLRHGHERVGMSRAGGFSVAIAASSEDERFTVASARCAVAVGRAMVVSGESPSLELADDGVHAQARLVGARTGVWRVDDMLLRRAHSPALILELGLPVGDEESRISAPDWLEMIARRVSVAASRCVNF